MKTVRRVAVVVVIGTLAIGQLPAGRAAAHAELVDVDPAPGAVLEQPPDEVVARFDEELDAEASTIELIDASGGVVARGTVDLDDLDHRTMTIAVPRELPDGAFAVRWQVASVADHHPVVGETGFAVGDAEAAGALAGTGAAPGRDDRSTTRWLVLGGGAVALALLAVIGRRARRRSGRSEPEPEPVGARSP